MDEAIDFDDILVPTDGSKSARRGAEQAIRFAKRNGATLHVLYAMNMGDVGYVAVPSDIEETRRRLEKERSSRRSKTSQRKPRYPALRPSRRIRRSKLFSSTLTNTTSTSS